jgi:hypothetical protein
MFQHDHSPHRIAARQVGERKRPDDDTVYLFAVRSVGIEARRDDGIEGKTSVWYLRHAGVLNGDLIRFTVRR